MAALSDLEQDHQEVFFRGPEAIEFLGGRVENASQYKIPVPEGSGSDTARYEPSRFYTRAAIVFWPRSKRWGLSR